MKIGDKVKMESERNRYTIQAFNDRFVIMTKPFNAMKTYLYTIADRKQLVRGPVNLIFGLPMIVNYPKGAEDLLFLMDNMKLGVSRKSIPLNQSEIDQLWPLSNMNNAEGA